MIAVAFPGQGIQKSGMVTELNSQQEECFTLASNILGYDLLDLCRNGPQDKLNLTKYAQPAIMVTCYASWLGLNPPVKPRVLLGHSLGLITALIVSGAISFQDGVKIVAKRGQLMHEMAPPGMMLVVLGMELFQVEEIVNRAKTHGVITVANYNSPHQFVLSGEREAIKFARQLALDAGAKRAMPLQVSGPFHSELMEAASEEFAAYLGGFSFNDPLYPVMSNSDNRLITNRTQVTMELIGGMTKPVKWIDNVLALPEMGVTKLLEIGPSKVLVGLTKRITGALELISFS